MGNRIWKKQKDFITDRNNKDKVPNDNGTRKVKYES